MKHRILISIGLLSLIFLSTSYPQCANGSCSGGGSGGNSGKGKLSVTPKKAVLKTEERAGPDSKKMIAKLEKWKAKDPVPKTAAIFDTTISNKKVAQPATEDKEVPEIETLENNKRKMPNQQNAKANDPNKPENQGGCPNGNCSA